MSHDSSTSRTNNKHANKPVVMRTAEGQFALLKKIGLEGAATLYIGKQIEPAREVLALLYPMSRSVELIAEKHKKKALNFRHPDAVRVLSCGVNKQCRYLIQELVRERRLSELLIEQPTIPFHQAVLIIVECGKILLSAHRAGLVHLRFSSRHVWLVQGRQVKLSGFAENLVDGRELNVDLDTSDLPYHSDVRSLACLLKQLIGYEKGSDAWDNIANEHLTKKVRRKLETLLDAATDENSRRYEQMQEFLDDLTRLDIAAEKLLLKELIQQEPPTGSFAPSHLPPQVSGQPGLSPSGQQTSHSEIKKSVPKLPIGKLWLVQVAGKILPASSPEEILKKLKAGDLKLDDLIKPTRGGNFQPIRETEDFAAIVESLEGISVSQKALGGKPNLHQSPQINIAEASLIAESPVTQPNLKRTEIREKNSTSPMPKPQAAVNNLQKAVEKNQSHKTRSSSSAEIKVVTPERKSEVNSVSKRTSYQKQVKEPTPKPEPTLPQQQELGNQFDKVETVPSVDLDDELILVSGPEDETHLTDSDDELELIAPPDKGRQKPTHQHQDGSITAKKSSSSKMVERFLMLAIGLFGVATANAFVLNLDEPEIPRSDERGYVSKVYVDPEGKEYHYSLFIPYQLDPQIRPPAILHLHGGDGSENDGLNLIGSMIGPPVWQLRHNFPFVVIFPQARPKQGQWAASHPNARMAIGVLEEVIQEYQLDEDRIYLAGASSGGAGVWDIASAIPDRFAAIVPICAAGLHGSVAATPDDLAEIISNHNLQVWSGENLGDHPAVTWFNREVRKAMLANGRSPYFIRYAADGHNAWDNTYNNPAMYSWLLKQNRQINHSDAPRFKMLSRQDYLEVFDIRYGNHGLGEDEALIVTMQDYYHPSRITLKHHDASEYELHFDVSLDRVGGIKIWFGTQDSLVENGYVAEIMRPEEGNGGLKLPHSDQWSQSNSSYSESSLQVSYNEELTGWNDVRLVVTEEEISLKINGWNAFQHHLESEKRIGKTIAFELIPQKKQVHNEQIYQETVSHWSSDNKASKTQLGQERPPLPAIRLQNVRIRLPTLNTKPLTPPANASVTHV